MTDGDGGLERRLGIRRLTARSVIASTLLGTHPPELTTRSLVATAELLGVAAGTARVAMSRMVAAGELEAAGDGYRLVSPTLLARQERQNRSRSGPTVPWDGRWRMAVVAGDARAQADRLELRSVLTTLRFGELREGVWLRPDNLPPAAPHHAGVLARQCTTLHAQPEVPEAMAAVLWDLDHWADRAGLLLGEVRRLLPPLAAGDPAVLAEGFVVSAAVLRHFQADPLLPAEVLPSGWPGGELRARYDAFDAAFRTTLVDWQRRQHLDSTLTARPSGRHTA